MSRRRSTRLRDAALRAAASGLYVFPCTPRGKTPAIRAWEQAATRDPGQINRWWTKGAPYNIGAATGPSNLVVIDLDQGRGDPAPEPFTGARNGRDVLAMLAERAGQPAPFDTATVATATGGLHLYYRAPRGVQLRNTAGTLGFRIDSRAQGVVAAVSVSRNAGVLVGVLRVAGWSCWSSAVCVSFPSPADMAEITLGGSR